MLPVEEVPHIDVEALVKELMYCPTDVIAQAYWSRAVAAYRLISEVPEMHNEEDALVRSMVHSMADSMPVRELQLLLQRLRHNQHRLGLTTLQGVLQFVTEQFIIEVSCSGKKKEAIILYP